MLSVRKLCFAGALLAVAPFAVFAAEQKVDAPVKDAPKAVEAPKGEPKAMPANPMATPPAVTSTSTGNCGTPTATVGKKCVMVPTQVQETRTVYKPVQKTETYTAYKTETIQEKKVVDVTTYKTVTETVMENRTTCVKVPVWEEKCVMETRKKIEWVTEYKEKCKLSFSKECKTIGHDGCGDKCGHGGHGLSLSFPVITPHLDKETVAVCVPKCTTESVPVMKKVCTYKTETKTECVPVCKTKCVPCVEKKEITCCKTVQVPYQATRCVTVCEPVCETVTVCKMVPTWVDDPCGAPAAGGCGDPCANGGAGAAAGGCGNAANGCGGAASGCGDAGCGNASACGSSSCCLLDKFKGCFNFGGCFSHKCSKPSCDTGCGHAAPACNTGCNTAPSCDTGCSKPSCDMGHSHSKLNCHINLCNPCGFLTKFKGCLCK